MRTMWKVLLLWCAFSVNTTVLAGGGAADELAGSFNALGWKLLAQTRQADPGKNVFLSPPGLGMVLSMAANGAQNETLRQMLATFQFKGGVTELNHASQALLEHFSQLNGKVQLEMANSLWAAADAKIQSPFLEVNAQFYGAKAASVDFKDPATANKINDWVSEATHGKIPRMVQPPLAANRLILLDAIYFKGDWEIPFDRKLTRDLPFTLGNGEPVTQPRMQRTGQMDYCENSQFQAVRLPYVGRGLSACIFLPTNNLGDFVKELTPKNWRQWQGQFRARQGTLSLPRFKLENEYKLNDILKAMGMIEPFSRQANFRGICGEPLYIDWIRQKTYVDVNEEGTVAAAVTGMGFRAMAVRMAETPFQMVVDRPFFLAICDNQSKAVLFLGAILDPRS